MKSYKRKYVIKPRTTFLDILNRLKKEDIKFDDFLKLLEISSDRFYENSELEFELLLINGFPIDIKDDFVYLKTKNRALSEQVFCFVDIETNGGSVKNGSQIIELGAIKYKNGKIIDSFTSLVFAKDIPIYVQELTQITPMILENAPVIQKVLQEFKTFLADDIFVAHDVNFDYNFINDSFEKYNLGKMLNRNLCTINLSKRAFKCEKYGLSSLKEFLNIDVEFHHRAYFDALTTLKVFEKAVDSLDLTSIKSGEDLIDFSISNKIKSL